MFSRVDNSIWVKNLEDGIICIEGGARVSRNPMS